MNKHLFTDLPPASQWEDISIHQLFERKAVEFADNVALELEGQRMTYRELNRRANRLAHFLKSKGIQREAIVGILLERSFDLVACMLAILKAGGAYLPIDPTCPKDRIKFMLRDANAPILLTQQSLAGDLSEANAAIVCLDDAEASLIQDQPETDLENVTGGKDLAYVIYTSGSTGSPKGVLVTHHNVVRLFQQTHHWYRFNESDVWTFFHSCAFDFSVWEIWGALLYGGRLVIVPYMTSRSPESFYELLGRAGVTVLNQTPSAFRQLIRLEQSLAQPRSLALRYIIFGGEALEMQTLKPWFDRHGDQTPQLINMYGITETTVHVTYRPLRSQDIHSGSVIGVPIPDLSLHVLDSGGKPVAVGESGELFVGGFGLARGYLNRPDLTAERFIPNRFNDQAGDRLYRTGDLVRLLPDGELEYLGRIDQQVKIRGFRIELGEIEAQLVQHPSVSEAVVLPHDDDTGNKRLAAYIIPQKGPLPLSNALRAFLRVNLPEYMVPSAFTFVETFPLNGNGKLDQAALKKLLATTPAPTPGILPPGNDLESKIRELWVSVLRGVPVGLDDNFFDLGGDSLLLAQLHVRLQTLTGREFPITDLFTHTTVRKLAAHLGSGEKNGQANPFHERGQRQKSALMAMRSYTNTTSP